MAAVSLLSAKGLVRRFGGLAAVDNVDLELAQGEIRAVIGPNGAGKTTLVSLISGRLMPDAGRITLDGRDITALPSHRRVRLGIAYTFQITSIFPRLTLFDNVALAAHKGRRAEVLAALDRVGLGGRADEPAGIQSYGHQRLLEVAMGLALEPRLLILDEPTQGLADAEVESFVELIRDVARQRTVMLIEHNMDVVMALAHRISVMDQGRLLAEGTPDEIRANQAVQSAYLGTG